MILISPEPCACIQPIGIANSPALSPRRCFGSRGSAVLAERSFRRIPYSLRCLIVVHDAAPGRLSGPIAGAEACPIGGPALAAELSFVRSNRLGNRSSPTLPRREALDRFSQGTRPTEG